MTFPFPRFLSVFLGLVGTIAPDAAADPSWKLYDESNSGLADDWCGIVRIGTKGEIWIGGVVSGLMKFDGANWMHWDLYNSNIRYDMIQAMDVDATGRVWIGTYKGLSVFDGSSFTNYDTINAGFDGNSVDAVKAAPDGKIWIATHAGSFDQKGVTVFDGKSWTTLPVLPANARNDEISSIAFTPSSTAWIGSMAGLVRWDGQFRHFPMAYTGQWHSDELAVDAQGILWSTGFQALLRYNGTSWKTYDYEDVLGIDPNTSCALAPTDKEVWLGCGRKLLRFDRATERVEETFDSTNSPIGARSIWSIAIDKDGALWMGTLGGLLKMDPAGGTGVRSRGRQAKTRLLLDPSGRRLMVRFQDPGTRRYLLRDATGRVVSSGAVDREEASIDLVGIPAGTLLLELRTGDGEHVAHPVFNW